MKLLDYLDLLVNWQPREHSPALSFGLVELGQVHVQSKCPKEKHREEEKGKRTESPQEPSEEELLPACPHPARVPHRPKNGCREIIKENQYPGTPKHFVFRRESSRYAGCLAVLRALGAQSCITPAQCGLIHRRAWPYGATDCQSIRLREP